MTNSEPEDDEEDELVVEPTDWTSERLNHETIQPERRENPKQHTYFSGIGEHKA